MSSVRDAVRVHKTTSADSVTAEPGFGPHVRVFDPGTPAEEIQAALDAAAASGPTPAGSAAGRCAFLFKPGTYDVDVRLGSRTSVAGLGLFPDDVTINGEVRVEGQDRSGGGDSAVTGMWRAAENLAVVPPGGTDRRAVTRAAPPRRAQVRGRLRPGASARPVPGPPSAATDGTRTTTPGAGPAAGPVSRAKPFLYVDEHGRYRVFLPALRPAGTDPVRANGTAPGSSVPLDQFFVARPADSARTLNRALARGMHLLLTPGVYRLTDTIRVKWAGTVVLGLGFPTITPRHGVVPMTVPTTRGVRLAGLLFDAGPVESRVLLEVGTGRGGRTDPADPASVQDVFFRVGGAGAGRAATALVVDSDHVLLDNVRAWRAGHGTGAGTVTGTSTGTGTGRAVGTPETGVVVNGDHVLATGLFVEHFPKDNVVWNGEHGRALTFRNEPVPHPAA